MSELKNCIICEASNKNTKSNTQIFIHGDIVPVCNECLLDVLQESVDNEIDEDDFFSKLDEYQN